MKLLASLLLVIVGCSSTPDECPADQIEVVYLGGPRDDESVCHPRPATCDDPASCSDQDCIAAMYRLCESPYLGVACSSDFEPVIISCND
jgi:hypothetical protein